MVAYDNSEKKVERTVAKDWILLPEKLNVKINLKDEIRERGIYKTTVYNGDIILEGEFPKLEDILPDNLYPYNIGIGIGITELNL